MKNVWRWLAGALAVAFGVATVVEGGHVLFGGAEARAEAGLPLLLRGGAPREAR